MPFIPTQASSSFFTTGASSSSTGKVLTEAQFRAWKKQLLERGMKSFGCEVSEKTYLVYYSTTDLVIVQRDDDRFLKVSLEDMTDVDRADIQRYTEHFRWLDKKDDALSAPIEAQSAEIDATASSTKKMTQALGGTDPLIEQGLIRLNYTASNNSSYCIYYDLSNTDTKLFYQQTDQGLQSVEFDSFTEEDKQMIEEKICVSRANEMTEPDERVFKRIEQYYLNKDYASLQFTSDSGNRYIVFYTDTARGIYLVGAENNYTKITYIGLSDNSRQKLDAKIENLSLLQQVEDGNYASFGFLHDDYSGDVVINKADPSECYLIQPDKKPVPISSMEQDSQVRIEKIARILFKVDIFATEPADAASPGMR